jgi:hypothetical protein
VANVLLPVGGGVGIVEGREVSGALVILGSEATLDEAVHALPLQALAAITLAFGEKEFVVGVLSLQIDGGIAVERGLLEPETAPRFAVSGRALGVAALGSVLKQSIMGAGKAIQQAKRNTHVMSVASF